MRRLEIDGRPSATGEEPPAVEAVLVSDGYFETLGIPLVRGRVFVTSDGTPAQPSVIVNDRFADLYFPDEAIIGSRIRLTAPAAPDSDAPWLTIVGVSRTVNQNSVARADPVVYLPLRAALPATSALVIRSRTDDVTGLLSVVREAVREIDPVLPLYSAMPLTEAVRQATWNARLSNVMANGITALVLLLALVGIFAVTSRDT